MGSCREILTLQLGSYANFVGSHLWSIQEMGFNYSNDGKKSEICQDVLFREGLTSRGDITFTPRVLCVERDIHHTPIPTLDENFTENPLLWDQTRVEKMPSAAEQLHQFIQDLDAGEDTLNKEYSFESSVRGWGDLMRTRLHPRSILTGYKKLEDDLENRIRLYVEECDNIQGFHILVDASETYSEVTSFLDDEYSSKIRLTFPVVSGVGELPWGKSAARFVRTFLNYHDAASFSTLTVPLSCVKELSIKREIARTFPDLSYDLQTNYHTSAILASFLDTFSLTYRTQENALDMADVLCGLTSKRWKFSGASLALPFGIKPGTSLKQHLEDRDDETPLWSSVTPNTEFKDSWYESFVLRGVPGGEVLHEYLQFLSSTVSTVRTVANPIPTLAPFPKIFSTHVSTRGSVDPTATRASGFNVSTVPVLAGLHACPGVGDMLTSMTDTVSKINLRRLPEIDMELDVFADRIETMSSLATAHSLLMDID